MFQFLRRVVFGERELPPLHPDYRWERGEVLPTEKEVIMFTEPRDAAGYIDYETALNEHLRGTIKPEENAMALLAQAFGPIVEDCTSYYNWLGITPPSKDGNYLVSKEKFFPAHAQNDVNRQIEELRWRPWRAADYGWFVEWIRRNEEPLAMVVDASRRPAFFNPQTTNKGERGLLFGGLFFHILPLFKEVCELFALRATMRAGDGDIAGAWSDVFAALRISLILIQGGTNIEWLIGLDTGHIASHVLVNLIQATQPTVSELRAHREAYTNLPPMGMLESKIHTERVLSLDLMQAIHLHGIQGVWKLEHPEAALKPPDECDAQFREAVDWRMAMANVHTLWDRVLEIHRRPTHAERKVGWSEMARQWKAAGAEGRKLSFSRKALSELHSAAERDTFTRRLIYRLGAPSCQWLVQMSDAEFRWVQTRANMLVLFALAEHKADAGEYPEQLADLVPKYLDAIPNGVFSGKPLVYTKTRTGYLFYTAGPNGADVLGRLTSDDPPGQNIGVRMASTQMS